MINDVAICMDCSRPLPHETTEAVSMCRAIRRIWEIRSGGFGPIPPPQHHPFCSLSMMLDGDPCTCGMR